MKTILYRLINFFALALISTSAAASLVIDPVASKPNPKNMVPGAHAIINYTVQNINYYQSFQAAGVVNLSPGVRQIYQSNDFCGLSPVTVDQSVCGYGSSNGRFPLAAQVGTCNLVLCAAADQIGGIGSSISGGPRVCGDPDANYFCDVPAGPNQMDILIIDPTMGAQISASPDPYDMPAGSTVTWTMTNTSSQYAYQIYPNGIPPDMINYITNINASDCFTLAPSATCTITANVSSNAPIIHEEQLCFSGANTNNACIEAGITKSALQISPNPVVFEAGASSEVVVVYTNISDIPLTNFCLSFPTITGIAPITGSNTCGDCSTQDYVTLPAGPGPGNQCSVTLAAASNAEGSGVMVANYYEGDPPAFPNSASVTVTVADPIILINEGYPIQLSIGTPELDVTIQNTSPYLDAENIQVDFYNPIPGISMDASACIGTIPKNGSCIVKFITQDLTSNPHAGGAYLQVLGDNVVQTSAHVSVADLVITLDKTFRHLQYQRIEITNNIFGSSVNIGPAIFSASLNSSIVQCDGVIACDGYDEMNICGDYLSEGDTCYLLFKSVEGTTLASNSGTISVEVNERGNPNPPVYFFPVFYADQSTSLYVAGNFNQANNFSPLSVNNIASWDGTTWSVLDQGLIAGSGRTLAFYYGDLYAGGTFPSAGNRAFTNYLGRWDGAMWNSLGTDYANLDGAVNTLAIDNNNNLIVGGNFRNILQYTVAKDDKKKVAATIAAPSLAVWNPTQSGLKPLTDTNNAVYGTNGNVYSMLYTDTFGLNESGLFVGGNFVNGTSSSAGNTLVNNVARLQNTSGWFPLLHGMNSPVGNATVFSLLLAGNSIYAVGEFVSAGFNEVNYVAQWDPTQNIWLASGTPTTGFDNFGKTLAYFNGSVYAGGAFSGYVRQYDSGTNTWSVPLPIGTLIDGPVEVLYTPSDNVLYIGGQFNQNNNLLSYDGSVVSSVGNGVTSTTSVPSVQSLLVAPSIFINPINPNP